MKKSNRILWIIVVILVCSFVSSSPATDFEKQIKRAAYYGENYEAANPDFTYAKVLVYLYDVEEELNSLLRITSESKITTNDLINYVGEPDYTTWVLDSDQTSEVQLDKEVPVFIGKIIFDGQKVQIKINIFPYIGFENKINYQTKLSIIFKDSITMSTFNEKLSEVEKLSKIYSLDTTIENANNLAEEAINLEAISEQIFKQTKDPYKTILEIFGEENLVKSQNVIEKEYEIFNGENKIIATLSICEDCNGIEEQKFILLSLEMQNKNNEKISYYYDNSFFVDDQKNINGLKADLIEKNSELSTNLENNDFSLAYQSMKDLQKISEAMNTKMNDGDEQTKIENFISVSQFYGGLFEGYSLLSTAFYKEKIFQKNLFIEIEGEKQEICNNNVDDNDNEKIDCNEDVCSGQICGTKTTITLDNETNQINLYCISGECKEKEKTETIIQPICGNGICEENENNVCTRIGINETCIIGTCLMDCGVVCQTFPAIECSGEVLFKGNDQNGCPLHPICVEIEKCTLDTDCIQPLCGKTYCEVSSGSCKLKEVDQCSPSDCVDGEKKICPGTTELVTEICKFGSWVTTGEICLPTSSPPIKGEVIEDTVTPDSTKPILKQNTINIQCTVSTDCKNDMVCSAGTCNFVASNNKKNTEIQSQSSQVIGVGISGFTINLGETGNSVITGGGFSATGVIPDTSNPEVFAEPDPSTVPARVYEAAKPTSRFTGVVDTIPGEEIILETDQEELLTGIKGDRDLPTGVKELLSIEGIYKVDKNSEEAIIYVLSSGEKFGAISKLLDRYRKEGAEWQSRKLKLLQEEKRELSRSFNNDFAEWYFNKFLVSKSGITTKKNALYSIYNYNFEKEKEIAQVMNRLQLKSLEYVADDFITINYESELGQIKCDDFVSAVTLPGLREVQIPILSMDAVVFYPKDFIKESYKIALEGKTYPLNSQERNYNFGLTDLELKKLKNNDELKSKIRTLLQDKLDNSFDAEISFVSIKEDGSKELIYNLFVSLTDPNSEVPVKIYPMLPEEIPTGIDSRIEVNFDELYDLLQTSEENSWRYTLHPEWDTSFRSKEKIELIFNWINIKNKIRNVKNSLVITPENADVEDTFINFIYTLGESTKPQDI